MIRVPRPRVVSVQHRHPGLLTAGDRAEARLDPGLIALLESPAAGTPAALGDGFQARYTVPVQVATTAVHALIPSITPPGTYWVGRDIDVEWFGCPGLQDTILATARLEEFNSRLARFTVSGRTLTGQALYRGTLHMGSMRTELESVRARLEEAARFQQPTERGGVRIVAPGSIPLGRSANVRVEVSNPEDHEISITVTAHPPFGAGLSLDSPPVE